MTIYNILEDQYWLDRDMEKYEILMREGEILWRYFNNRQLSTIPDHILDRYSCLEGIDFSENQLSKIPVPLFEKSTSLRWILFGKNQLYTIPGRIFDKCTHLQTIDLSNNQLSKLPDHIFDKCTHLQTIDLSNNQLSKLPDHIFDECRALVVIRFNNNQLLKIPDHLVDNCPLLEYIDFSYNRVKTLHVSLFSHLIKVRSLNLEKNNIETVSFRSLVPLSNCDEINLTDQNHLYNSKSLYSLMFKQLPRYREFQGEKYEMYKSYFDKFNSPFTDSKFGIIRNNLVENKFLAFEKNFLAFYLSSNSLSSKSLKDLQSKFDLAIEGKDPYNICSEFSLLDLFISIFGEIDDSKIINLKKHIDQLILKDDKLENIEFLIRSKKSISKLCTRNIACHFETFFPNTFYELISRVRKTSAKAVDFKSEEESAFKYFCKYIAIAKEPDEIIFHQIDYTECFNIALKNKNLEIAKFIVVLLRYYVMVWSDFKEVFWTKHLIDSKRAKCSEKAQAALNKFNRNLFLKFEFIFEKENHLNEIVMFLMDIKLLDHLK